jgi:PAS domain S-box-containing protein
MQASRDLIGDWRLVNALGDAGPLLDQLTEQSPVGIAVIDLAGRLCSVNPAYCRLYGYPAQALLGQPFASLFPAAQREWVMSLHRRFLLDGTGLDGEWDLIRQDGQRVSVMAQSVRVRDAQGQPCRLVYVVDISQRRGAERALHASQQFLQSVLDGLTAQVCVLDDAGTIVAVNQAWRDFAAANGGPEDPLGEGSNYLAVCQRAAQAVGEAACTDAGHFAQQLRQVLGGARPGFELEYAAHSPHERRWFVARVARVAGSQPPCTVVAHDNVTALKQAQETLRDGEALLLDLAASIPGAMFRLLQRAGGGWRFVYFSPGIESLFELTPQAACGDIRILGAHILPEDKPTHDQSIRDAVARGRFWEHEYRIRTPSGRLKWVHAKARSVGGRREVPDDQRACGAFNKHGHQLPPV